MLTNNLLRGHIILIFSLLSHRNKDKAKQSTLPPTDNDGGPAAIHCHDDDSDCLFAAESPVRQPPPTHNDQQIRLWIADAPLSLANLNRKMALQRGAPSSARLGSSSVQWKRWKPQCKEERQEKDSQQRII